MATLPASVLAKTAFAPSIEDFILPLLWQELPEVPAWSLLPEAIPPEFGVLVRKALGPGSNATDPRGFLEDVYVEIDCFTTDPDGDENGELLAKAVGFVLRDAWLNATVINNTWISRFEVPDEPARKADFVDSSGPVQYADLPQGYWRYQARYRLLLRHNVQ